MKTDIMVTHNLNLSRLDEKETLVEEKKEVKIFGGPLPVFNKIFPPLTPCDVSRGH